jgi:hypothetical protein
MIQITARSCPSNRRVALAPSNESQRSLKTRAIDVSNDLTPNAAAVTTFPEML